MFILYRKVSLLILIDVMMMNKGFPNNLLNFKDTFHTNDALNDR